MQHIYLGGNFFFQVTSLEDWGYTLALKKQKKKSCDIDEDWAKPSIFFVIESDERKIWTCIFEMFTIYLASCSDIENN